MGLQKLPVDTTFYTTFSFSVGYRRHSQWATELAGGYDGPLCSVGSVLVRVVEEQ